MPSPSVQPYQAGPKLYRPAPHRHRIATSTRPRRGVGSGSSAAHRVAVSIFIEEKGNGILIAVAESHTDPAGGEAFRRLRPRGPVMIEDPQRVTLRRPDTEALRVLESCAFTWIFDGARGLFRRLPRKACASFHVPMSWSPYCRLEIDESRSSVVVTLNPSGTRLLRVALHADPCDRCRPERRAGLANRRATVG
jgi:hypothetical protein